MAMLDGDDWFHLRRFPATQSRLLHLPIRRAQSRRGHRTARYEDYDNFLGAVRRRLRQSAGSIRFPGGENQEHPAYDSFWQEQALDRVMAAQP